MQTDKQCQIPLYHDNISIEECKYNSEDIIQSNDNYSNLGLIESYSKKNLKKYKKNIIGARAGSIRHSE